MIANLESESDFSGVVDAAREIASRRRDLLIQAKRAQMRGDVKEVFRIIDILVPDSVVNSHDKTSDSVVKSFHRSSGRR